VVEIAPLRPVPRRPAGPVEPELAIRRVAERLPKLPPAPRDALALVTLAGRTRAEAAARLDLSAEEFGLVLARGRKELRRSLYPLAGSGWCERAELLVSDRLDDAIDDVGSARLGVHLRNCPRCVEHERRLVQAIDSLVGEPPPTARAEAAPVRLAEVRALPRSAIGLPPIASLPFGVPVTPGTTDEAASTLPGIVASAVILVLMALAAWAGAGAPLP
jgi:hypothetical protein